MMTKPAPLSRNLITLLGLLIFGVSFGIGVVLIITDILLYQNSPYNALVTYMLIPMMISAGLTLAVLGLIIEWWRRKRRKTTESHFPVLDLNLPGTRKHLMWIAVVFAIFFSVSSVATYRAFIFTESTEFCGAVCHQIMTPEYTAYQHSPHARVQCVECHIGEGAEWYARSKVSGLRQVYRTILGSYELPIEVPVHNLRPARETCEECHWPEKFTGTIEREQWHFWRDEENTPMRILLLMKVGGTVRETGHSEGIHWHTSSNEIVRYWPKDRQRLEIPWVEVQHADGTKTVYRGEGAPEGRPPEDEIRIMDCIDCHNRPSHIYWEPDVMLNRAMAAGTLDRSMPMLKDKAMELLLEDYESQDEALTAIRQEITSTYNSESEDIADATIEKTIATLSEIYRQTQFPEQHVTWRTYPNHIGHRTFPGCFRCHNDEHESEDGKVISMDCNNCHEFVYQASGKDVFGPVQRQTQNFIHPGGMDDIWEGSMCTDCHAPENL